MSVRIFDADGDVMEYDDGAFADMFREYANWVDSCVTLQDDTSRERLLLGGFGLAGESGEVVDALKKYVFHGKKEADTREKVVLELGDVLWYYTLILSTMGITLDEVIAGNIAKLDKRHAEGYYDKTGVKAPRDFEFEGGC